MSISETYLHYPLNKIAANISLLLFVASVALGQPQRGTIRGHVMDEGNKQPLVGVNITVKGTVLGTASDQKGAFALTRVPVGQHTIYFSMLGYERKQIGPVTVRVDQDQVIEVRLRATAIPSEPVVVTASRREQRIQEAPVSIATITASELQMRNSVTLDDALRYIPGVNMVQDQINIRGSSGYSRGVGSRVLLLLDGLPLLTGDTGEINWEAIPIQQIEHIEVVKGAGSALYGSSALGGVINVITRDVSEGSEVRFKLYSGLYDSPRYEEWKWWDRPRFNSGAVLSFAQKTGALGFVVSLRRSVDESFRVNDVYHRWNFSTMVKYDLSSTSSIAVAGNYLYRTHGNYFWWKSIKEATVPADAQLNGLVRSRRGNVSLAYKEFLSDRFFYSVKGIYFGNFWKDDSAGRVGNVSSSHVMHGEVQGTYEISRKNILTMGFSVNFDRVNSSLFGDHEGLGAAGYVQHEFLPIEPVRLTAGVRYDFQKVSLLAGSSLISPKISAVYSPREETSIRGSLGTGFRYPSIGELFVQSSTNVSKLVIIPNDKLRAEKSISAEIGVSQSLTDRIHVDASFFNNDFRDLIEAGVKIKKIRLSASDTTEVERAVAEFENVTRARIQGSEINIKIDWLQRLLTTDLGYTYIWPRDLTEDAPLKFRPRHLLHASASLQHQNFSASVDFRFVSRIERIDDALVRLAPIIDGEQRVPIRVFDLHTSYLLTTFGLPLRLGFNINNLLNYHYVELIGNLAPVRTFFLTVEGAF